MVRVDDLDKLPEPVRRYFDDWGRKTKVLGVAVVSVDMMLHWDHRDWAQKKHGRGPGHTVDNHEYRVGGKSINDWIDEHQKIVHQIFGSEERHDGYGDD